MTGTTSSTIVLTYSDVQGGWSGEGNIDLDPLFLDAYGRLSAGSPCIDAGDNDCIPADTGDLDGDGDTTEPVPFDFDGNPRIQGVYVDMGAFEALIPIQLVIDLIEQVTELNIQSGISNGLEAKLDAVSNALDNVNENNDIAALNGLIAFINAVEAQSGNKILEEDADALIAAAQQIIDLW